MSLDGLEELTISREHSPGDHTFIFMATLTLELCFLAKLYGDMKNGNVWAGALVLLVVNGIAGVYSCHVNQPQICQDVPRC